MPDLTGQRLGQYQILSRIGQGSTATVYKAYQPKLDRYVAIKVLSPHVVDEEGFLDRFIQEARAAAQLDHPNILPVYDFDQIDYIAYIVFKYIGNGTLRDRMTGSPIELGLAVDIVAQIGKALDYAHEHGVLHRDVKPGNILIGDEGWALLTDFGLAKILNGGQQLTHSGSLMGTPDYISPEHARGMPGDGRSDLYSLGATLYEMLTGRKPFDADGSISVVIKHMIELPPSPRQFNPDLSEAVEKVVLTALEKEPTKRFQTAEEMTSALVRAAKPLLDQAPVRAARQTPKGVACLAKPALASLIAMWTEVKQLSGQARIASLQIWKQIIKVGLQASVDVKVQLAQQQRIRFVEAFLAACILLLVSGNVLLVRAVTGASSASTTIAARPTSATALPAHMAPIVSILLSPYATPSPTPPVVTATPSPVPQTAMPKPTPEWTFLPSSARIRPGIWVKIVRPAGLDIFQEAGFDQEFIATLGKDRLVYVLQGPVRANSLSWIAITDGVEMGWGVQDYVTAYGIRNMP